MQQIPDLQAQRISDGLTQLEDLLEKPVATNALELGKNAGAALRFETLKRLRKSLRQYLERDSNLFYVGLLGHFSAGKSSTINSLLNAWGSSKERKTSLTPTDTTITLITNEQNANALFGVIREGHVPIRLEKIESDLLKNLVLVDTPGTGDPQFIEEVARDFLPICDVILFLFSAASPVDKSDVPLLEELHRRLPFIPLHFVVTRSDEFRTNQDSLLTDSNFDAHKMKGFLDTVVDRVNKILTPQVYQSGSFTFIDNRAKFGIDRLAQFLAAKCDAANPNAHVSMHMNKLLFYLGGARELKTYFSKILDQKLSELSKIVSAAARNIDRYQQVVGISNSNLAKIWTESSSAISAVSASMLEALKAPAVLPASFSLFPLAAKKRNDIAIEFQRDSKANARSISLSLKTELYTAFRDHFYHVEESINKTSLRNMSAASHTISTIPIDLALNNFRIPKPSMLLGRVRELRDAEVQSLRDALMDIRRATKQLEDSLQQGQPFKKIESVIFAAQQSLRSDLSSFFQNVELYRSGVFAHTTKESIATWV